MGYVKRKIQDEDTVGFIFQAVRDGNNYVPLVIRVEDNMKLFGNPEPGLEMAISAAKDMRRSFPPRKVHAQLYTPENGKPFRRTNLVPRMATN